jgi:hypothetical protein
MVVFARRAGSTGENGDEKKQKVLLHRVFLFVQHMRSQIRLKSQIRWDDGILPDAAVG